MAILKVVCPGCAKILKASDPDGFAPDAKIKCPHCQQRFTANEGKVVSHKAQVADDSDEDEEDEPREKKPKKKKKRQKSGGGSYKTSPVRFAILGVLVIVLGILGYMLYLKRTAEGG